MISLSNRQSTLFESTISITICFRISLRISQELGKGMLRQAPPMMIIKRMNSRRCLYCDFHFCLQSYKLRIVRRLQLLLCYANVAN